MRLDSTTGKVIDSPLTFVVQRPFTLACSAFSNPPANYTWTGGVHVAQNQLLLDTLSAKVNTTRTCTARSTLNPSAGAATMWSSSATVTIEINYPPESVSIRHESESGTVIQSEFRVIEGNATRLFCSVQSQPVSSFSWSGAGFHSRGSYLVHSKTLRSQTGVLSCLAENNMTHGYHVVKGSASGNISLNVLYPPKLQALPRKNALEGNGILIQCSYTVGNPMTTKSMITRTTDGQRWSGASHTFQSINRTDAGLYRCTVENSMDPTGAEMRAGSDTADFEINVWYKPSISRFEVSAFPNQNIVTINESERLSIVCEVTSNPNSTIRLKQTHMTIALMERDNVLGLEYAIQNASCSDAAVYTCAAFNNYTDMERASSKDMQLFVRCSPRPSDSHAHLRRNFTGTVHGNVTLSFMAVAYPPPMFEWQKWNGTSYNRVIGETYNITSSDLFTSLTVLDIQVDDFVSYILKVSNGIQPYLREVFHLNPQDVPQCPTDFTLLSKSTGIATVQWKRAFNGGLQQTFVLVYKKSSNSKYFTISEPEDKETAIYNTELSYLEAGQLYDVILYSQNVIGPCRENRSLKIELDAEDTPPALAPVIGGVVGGGLGAAVAVVAIVFILRRKYTLNCSMSLSKKKDVPPGQNGDSADNPGYDAAEMYEQVQAKKETPVYDDLNDGNDRPDHSHLYTPLEESNPRSSIHYENVKREDPIYHNMVM
ncbi:synaptogenesis protein syg-2-like [Mya arenaria]|uniref:synaptogenesis protein syg-2-like n=1 Tax=Mya arenaria TaxID=6604 RepID=UPI0022E2976B|nr:synaptogenesis protein syg-2-like [Mya arenaria]